jgi:hypothetical protein
VALGGTAKPLPIAKLIEVTSEVTGIVTEMGLVNRNIAGLVGLSLKDEKL